MVSIFFKKIVYHGSSNRVCIVHAGDALLLWNIVRTVVSCDVVGIECPPCGGVCWAPLPGHTLWVCPLGCRVCWFCGLIVFHSVPVVVWIGTSGQYVFAFFDEPILVAMLFPLVLSVCMRMFTFVVVASLMKLAMCRPSCAPVPIAYSSDSADDSATTACVLLPNCTTDPIIVTMNPLVDFLVFGHPAQSAST